MDKELEKKILRLAGKNKLSPAETKEAYKLHNELFYHNNNKYGLPKMSHKQQGCSTCQATVLKTLKNLVSGKIKGKIIVSYKEYIKRLDTCVDCDSYSKFSIFP